MSNAPSKFSARDQQLMSLAWQCMDSEPKIDYKKLSQLAGLTEGSAKTMMGTLRRKLREQAAEADVTVSVPSTPKKRPSASTSTPKSKKRGGLDGPDELNGDESPTKKPRTPKSTKAKAKGKKSAMNSDDDDDEFADITIKNSEAENVKKEFEDMLMAGHL